MKYFLIAGEASGDLHGSNLMKGLKKQDPHAEFHFFGGDLMQAEGGLLLKHYREMAFMGAIEVVANLRTIKKNFALCKSELLAFSPDVLILIDYPGFNLKMAEFAKQNGLKVFYYISPKIWAWKEWRIKQIKAFVDEMFTIFPFETDFFNRFGYKVHYVGNPLLDEMVSFEKNKPDHNFLKDLNPDSRPVVALLPGSRRQEIKLILPTMIQLANEYPAFRFVVSGAPSISPEFYEKIIGDSGYPVVYSQTYPLLSGSYAAIVASGTATLETALFNVPQVVLYKMAGGYIGFKLVKLIFLKVKYVSLPNLVLNKEAVREFLMTDMKFKKIKPETDKLLNDENYREEIFKNYLRLKEIMGGPGASDRAAKLMFDIASDFRRNTATNADH